MNVVYSFGSDWIGLDWIVASIREALNELISLGRPFGGSRYRSLTRSLTHM